MCDGFEQSGEFLTLVSTLRGTSTGDNERVAHYVRNLYVGALGREPSATELQQHTQELNTAAAQGQSQVVAQAEQIGRAVFAAQVANPSMNTTTEFVTNLYEAFLQRGPDAGGLAHWPVQAANSRQSVLNYFATYPVTRELAATLYREVNWLVSDQLGTPRMVVDKSGSLAGVKRHDYLPFGEEIGAGTGGRTTAQGYSQADNVRQKFTSYERDGETGLDFAQARYFSSTQGRFTSVDPFDLILGRQGASDKEEAERQFRGYLGQPQHWNRYAYCLNNPLRHIDPDGFDPLIVNLNIIFDKNKYTKEQQQAFINSYVAQAQKDFGNIDVQFNVSVNEGTASNTDNHNTHEMTSGVVEGSINVFVTPGSVGPSPEVTNYSKGAIWISTGGSNNTENPGNLTHGLIHALGITGGVNGYTSPANTSSNKWYLLASAIGTALTSNDAESAAQAMQDHLRAGSINGKRIFPPPGQPFQDFTKQTNVLREGARKYLKK